MNNFEIAVIERGFESVAEFNSMVANVDMSTTERRVAFKQWQYEDGTKSGLQQLSVKSLNEDLKAKLKDLVLDCPMGYNGTKLVMGRWSTEADLIEWFGKLQKLAGIE